MTDKSGIFVLLGAGLMLLMALPVVPQSKPAAPRGSYLQTCSQIRMEGNILSALCERPRNLPLRSSINVAMCDGDISNKDGNLFCLARRGTWGQGRAIPRGSYVDSCENVIVVGTTLQAKCKNRDGGYTKGELDLTKCRTGSNITNIDGFLDCRRF